MFKGEVHRRLTRTYMVHQRLMSKQFWHISAMRWVHRQVKKRLRPN